MLSVPLRRGVDGSSVAVCVGAFRRNVLLLFLPGKSTLQVVAGRVKTDLLTVLCCIVHEIFIAGIPTIIIVGLGNPKILAPCIRHGGIFVLLHLRCDKASAAVTAGIPAVSPDALCAGVGLFLHLFALFGVSALDELLAAFPRFFLTAKIELFRLRKILPVCFGKRRLVFLALGVSQVRCQTARQRRIILFSVEVVRSAGLNTLSLSSKLSHRRGIHRVFMGFLCCVACHDRQSFLPTKSSLVLPGRGCGCFFAFAIITRDLLNTSNLPVAGFGGLRSRVLPFACARQDTRTTLKQRRPCFLRVLFLLVGFIPHPAQCFVVRHG